MRPGKRPCPPEQGEGPGRWLRALRERASGRLDAKIPIFLRGTFLDRSGACLSPCSLNIIARPAERPDAVKMAVLTPTTRPAESSKGPPELPGLMAASV